jgi:hypothetical protein
MCKINSRLNQAWLYEEFLTQLGTYLIVEQPAQNGKTLSML